MSFINETLLSVIKQQQAGKEGTPEWAIGEQLIGIASESALNAELIERDLQTDGMKLSDAAAALKKYADAHHGKAREFCIIPEVADKILRQFYGIEERKEGQPLTAHGGAPLAQGSQDGEFVDLSDFL